MSESSSQQIQVSRQKSPEMSDEEEVEQEDKKMPVEEASTTPPKQRTPSASSSYSSEGPSEPQIEQKVDHSLQMVHEPLIEQEVIDNQVEIEESLVMSTELPVNDAPSPHEILEEMIVKSDVLEDTETFKEELQEMIETSEFIQESSEPEIDTESLEQKRVSPDQQQARKSSEDSICFLFT